MLTRKQYATRICVSRESGPVCGRVSYNEFFDPKARKFGFHWHADDPTRQPRWGKPEHCKGLGNDPDAGHSFVALPAKKDEENEE